jgi:hypothetical protein
MVMHVVCVRPYHVPTDKSDLAGTLNPADGKPGERC